MPTWPIIQPNIGFIIHHFCIDGFTISKMNFSVVIYYDDDPERLLSPGGDPCLAISQTLGPCRGASSETPSAINLVPQFNIFETIQKPKSKVQSPQNCHSAKFTKIFKWHAFTKKKLGTLPPNTLMCSPFLCNLYQAIIWIILLHIVLK